MLSALEGFVSTLSSYPLLGLLLFLVLLVLVFGLMAGRMWAAGTVAVVRSIATIFSTPFVFLHGAFGILVDARKAESYYVGTREFVAFRYSRIMYLSVLLFSIIYLSGGVTASVFAIYPKSEIDQANELKSNIQDISSQLSAVSNGVASDVIAGLQAKVTAASAAYNAQVAADSGLQQTMGFNGPMISAIGGATDIGTLENLKNGLPAYFADCPLGPTWPTFTSDQCAQFRSKLSQLAGGKLRELSLLQAYNAAKADVDNVSQSESQRAEKQAQLNASLGYLQSQFASVDPSKGLWIWPHIKLSLSMLAGVVISLITFVWVSAIIIDIINWAILMMRSLEREHAARLEAPSQRVAEASTTVAAK